MQIVKSALIAVLAAVLASSAEALVPNITGTIETTCKTDKVIAMCWDDSPSTFTSELLAKLRNLDIKVTFHVTTLHLLDPNVRSLIKRMADDGHLVGLRTEAKWNLKGMSDDEIKSGIARQAHVLAKIIGYTPSFVRLPYGGYDERVLKAVQSTGLTVTAHSLDPLDYKNSTAGIVDTFKLALDLAVDNRPYISVQHDGLKQSVDALEDIVKVARQFNYKFVTLDDCRGMGNMREFKESLNGGDSAIDFAALGGDAAPSGDMGGPSVDGRIPGIGAQTSAAATAVGKAAALGVAAIAALCLF